MLETWHVGSADSSEDVPISTILCLRVPLHSLLPYSAIYYHSERYNTIFCHILPYIYHIIAIYLPYNCYLLLPYICYLFALLFHQTLDWVASIPNWPMEDWELGEAQRFLVKAKICYLLVVCFLFALFCFVLALFCFVLALFCFVLALFCFFHQTLD